MNLIIWIKENLDLLIVSVGGVFGFGGIVYTQRDHSDRLEDLENKEEKISDKLVEIHGDIQTLLERTKNL